MKLGNKLDPSLFAPKTETPTSKPATVEEPIPVETPAYTPWGRSFTGYGDASPTAGQAYTFLPGSIRQQINTVQRNPYALLATDDTQSTTLGDLLKQSEVKMPDGSIGYRLSPAWTQIVGRDQDEKHWAEQVGSREDFINRFGLQGIADDARIGFSSASSGRGDVRGTLTPFNRPYSADSSTGEKWRSRAPPQAMSAYQAIKDEKYKGFVQIGDIGPLDDDINQMLGQVYSKLGVNDNPAGQEAVKNALFKYDPRFGVLANSGFIEAASEVNNNRKQGFWEGPIGGAIIQAVATYVNPVFGAAVAAGRASMDGGNFMQIARSALASYAGGAVGGDVGILAEGMGSIGSAALGSAAGNVVSQAIGTGKVDPRQVLAAGVGGAAGAGVGEALPAGTSPTIGKIVGQSASTAARNLVLGRKLDPKQFAGIIASGIAGGKPTKGG